MEIDLTKIKEIAKDKEDENWEFQTFLKSHDMPLEQMDSMVHRLYERVSSEIDCTACGNCCREISPSLNQKNIERLSRGLAIHPDQFINQFLVENKENFSDGFLYRKVPAKKQRINLPDCRRVNLERKSVKNRVEHWGGY